MNLLFQLFMRKYGLRGTANPYPRTFSLTLSGASGGLSIVDGVGIGTITAAVTSLITPSIVLSRNSGVAPMNVFFDATATTAAAFTSKPLHHLKYRWVVSDGNTATHLYGPRAGVGLKNVMHGAIAAYCFETPGTWTVELQVSARLADGTLDYTTLTSESISVSNPNVVFAGTNTVAVANGAAPVAGVDGVPAGAACYGGVTTTQAVCNYGLSGTKRVLMKHDDSFTTTGEEYIQSDNLQFGKYGSGADPRIVQSPTDIPFFILDHHHNITFMDLHFVGGATNCNTSVATQFWDHNNITMLRCEVDKGCGVSMGGTGIMLVDSNIHDLRADTFAANGYVGFYSEIGKYIACVGSRIYDAHKIEHCLRFQGCSHIAINNSHFYGPANTKQAITIRGRSNQYSGHIETWSGVWCEKVYIHDNDIDSGGTSGQLVEFAPQNSGANEPGRDVIFERNYVHGQIGTQIVSQIVGTCTIRNNLFRSYVPFGGNTDGVILVLTNSQVGMAAPTDHEIYNNTCYKEAGATKFQFVVNGLDNNAYAAGNTTWPSGTKLQNNLVYAPDATSADYNNVYDVAASGPILIGTRLGSSAYPPGATGAEWALTTNSSDAQIKSTAPGFTVPPTTLASWKPTTGYALGGGAYHKGAFEDFFQTPYTGTARELGAVHA